VDYIQFDNPVLVERFLDYWRKTGNQRIGFLLGRYEYHKDVPLGIKAVVAAIYEPQQVNTDVLPDFFVFFTARIARMYRFCLVRVCVCVCVCVSIRLSIQALVSLRGFLPYPYPLPTHIPLPSSSGLCDPALS